MDGLAEIRREKLGDEKPIAICARYGFMRRAASSRADEKSPRWGQWRKCISGTCRG